MSVKIKKSMYLINRKTRQNLVIGWYMRENKGLMMIIKFLAEKIGLVIVQLAENFEKEQFWGAGANVKQADESMHLELDREFQNEQIQEYVNS